ncbi:hypothetical protein [Chamaesiphon sp. VAR_69_metabat_338]|uniref:hypothetical protein n=1 Tax=Chamaesiphon sp. VAR_69_metabat_338 TaxID=2964704 RepID=UPI00286E23F4|nr:hypothetical protein [Chamaesiphon sp. VAR_69_metabat_338]
MMDVQDLQVRVDRVASKRALLLQFQIDPTLQSLSLDIEQALLEMDDLMAEFGRTFPNEVVSPPTKPIDLA